MEGRRPRRPTSDRSVMWMTPEQVERKRALDRVNQRSSRANTRKRVDELEEEVARLLAALQESERERLRLQASESGLRSIIQTAFSSMHQLADTQTEITQTPAISPPEHQRSPVTAAPAVSPPIGEPQEQPPQEVPDVAVASGLPSSGSSVFSAADIATSDDAHILMADSSSGFTFGRPLFPKDDVALKLWDSSNPSAVASTDFLDAISLSFWNTGTGIDTVLADDSPTLPQDPGATMLDSGPPDVSPSVDNPPPWAVLPPHLSPSARIDQIIHALTQSRRPNQAEAATSVEFSSRTFPSIESLLNPSMERASIYPVSSTLGKNAPWMSVPSLPEKLALMYLICNMVRWFIAPTQRHYEAIPEFYRPTQLQRIVPHPAWVDLIAWPEARERIIQRADFGRYETQLRQLLADTLSVHWPHSPSSVITMASEDEIGLTPAFVSHIQDLRNWSVGPELVKAFPYLDCIPVRTGNPG